MMGINEDIYLPHIQEEPYPFGKFPLTKYEVVKCSLWHGVTTSFRTQEEVVPTLLKRAESWLSWGRTRIFKTQNGKKELIYDDQAPIPKEHLAV